MRYVPPTSWDKPQFYDVAEVITGSTPPTSDLANYGGDLPFITPAELDANEPITRASTTLSMRGASKARVLPKDAVLICCIGSLGKVGITGSKAAFNQQINALVFDRTRVDPRYGYHYCRTLKPILEHMAPSTTIAIVNKGRFQELVIPLPPLEEQCRIAAILDKADAVRRKRQQAIALTEELLRSAFLETFGDPITNPKGLQKTNFGELVSEKGQIVDGPFGSSLKPECYVSSGVRVVRNFNIQDDFFDESDFVYVTKEKFAEIRRSNVQPGDLLLSTKGTIGHVCIMSDLAGDSVLSASGTVRIRLPKNSPLLAEFIVQQMIQPNYKQYIKWFEAGTNQKYLNLAGIRKMELLVSPIDIQRKFISMRKETLMLKNKQEKLFLESHNFFNSLLQRAFRGEL